MGEKRHKMKIKEEFIDDIEKNKEYNKALRDLEDLKANYLLIIKRRK